MESLFIFKFGGSCLKNKESMEQSLKILDEYKSKGQIICVTSAFYGVTDKLLNWVKVSNESSDRYDSVKVLKDLENFHREVVELMITNEALKQECYDFLDKRFSELENKIPEILNKEMSTEIMDFILSYGERLSTYIYSMYLKDHGYYSHFLSPDDNILITNNIFGNALPILEIIEKTIPDRTMPVLNKNGIVCFSGYYGVTESGKVTTLGRGGTDFTATIIAYALANYYNIKVIFWKDVYGILSANPKFEPHAKLIKHISFAEAKELAFFGSKVLHPLCLSTAEKGNVEVELRNYNDPFSEKSTIISTKKIEEVTVVKSITSLENIAMITVAGESLVSLPGAAAKLFSIIGQNNININFISQSSSENNITFGVAERDGFKASQMLAQSKYFGKRWVNILTEHDVALIAVIGAGMANTPGIAGKVFTTLGDAGVNVRAIAQGSSELNITFVVKRNDLERAIKKLYHTFIEKAEETISLW